MHIFVYDIGEYNGMHHNKIISSQVHSIKKYENLKYQVLKCNSSVYFNKHCLNMNLIPKYTNIKISNASPRSQFTQHKFISYRLEMSYNAFM